MPSAPQPAADPRTSVVVATRDRCPELLRTLGLLTALPERPPVIVVDNGSSDGTAEAVRARYPSAHLIRLDRNIGATARNVGVQAAATRYVGFADDDSWWAPGALRLAADHLDAAPALAVLQARILVGPSNDLDPVCAEMAASPLPSEDHLPGPSLLGFVACGAVVRRRAFLDVGGFHDVLFFLGEEQLHAQDLAARGWSLAYAPDVVAHHHPSPVRDVHARRRREYRNELLATWMRRPLPVAATRTARLLASSVRDADARSALAEAGRRLPAALRARQRLPQAVEARVVALERRRPTSG